ncbi:MAG: ATP-binding protein [Saprospiraceae bacterium]|nr:ATP-binding protein [Saprospiraceae bacterium]
MKNKQIIAFDQLPEGMTIDMDEGWKKLISSQFGGSPGRAFPELIQNAIDSYDDVPIDQRQGEIETTNYSISIRDYGVGLNRNKITLLMTLGGTDKRDDPKKIGRFGMGFFSIFNKALGTKKVVVETNCEGQPVQLIFEVIDPEKPPEIKVHFPEKPLAYSTKIEVFFSRYSSVPECLEAARKSLKYYPCNMTINGLPNRSVWQDAVDYGYPMYEEGSMRGFVEPGSHYYYRHTVTLMCKYEYLGISNTYHFIKGGRNLFNDLRDFYDKGTPWLPGFNVTVNYDDLTLTISRDSYFLDYNFNRLVEFVNKMLLDKLAEKLKAYDTELIFANQYIFRQKIRQYVNDPEAFKNQPYSMQKVVNILYTAPVFQVKDQPEKYSLADIYQKRTDGIPVFYSSDGYNENWLGGMFKHDFILLPKTCTVYHGAPQFYRDLFSTCLGEAIDLDTIQENPGLIKNLVEREIIKKSLLSPKCDFVGETRLDDNQQNLLLEINALLDNPEIVKVVSHNLRIPINKIHSLFFEIREEGIYLATGLFQQDGIPVSDDFVTNFVKGNDEKEEILDGVAHDLVLGLSVNHPFIEYILESDNKYRALYALTYLASELTSCQKMLVPFSPFYHLVKEKLATSMRKALIASINSPDDFKPVN